MGERDRWQESVDRLAASAARVARLVAGLDDAAWRAPSLLPGWSRAHVGAHLVLNAEGFARALSTRGTESPLPVYDSAEARDADIAALAVAGAPEIADQLVRADAALADLLVTLPEPDRASGEVQRTPGGPGFALGDLPVTRRRELEVHAVDLGADYSRADWSADFVIELLDRLVADHAHDGPFSVVADDLDRTWRVGAPGGPSVRGRGADLAWWLSGRPGAVLAGELPPLSPWGAPAPR